MCINPLHIKNNTHYYNYDSRLYNTVPCGKCRECLQQKQFDIRLRMYYEFLSFRDSGKVFFYTLTYNEENLPKYHFIPSFDKLHCQSFLHALHEHFRSRGIRMSYFLTCEYGTRTNRPHYHAIFYIDSKINNFHFLSLMRKYWKYGFVCPGKNLGLVNSHHAITYCSKYVGKDLTQVGVDKQVFDSLHNMYKCRSLTLDNKFFVDFMRDCDTDIVTWFNTELERLTLPQTKTAYKEYLKRYSSFYLISKGFGFSMLNYINKDYSIDYPTKQGFKSFRLPLYAVRKIFYDVVKDEFGQNRYKLNDKGVLFRAQTIENKLIDLAEQYRSVSFSILSDDLSDFIKYLNTKHISKYSASSIKDIINKLNPILSQNVKHSSFYTLAVYHYVYRDYIAISNYDGSLIDSDISHYVDNILNLATDYNIVPLCDKSICDFENYNSFKSYLYNDLEPFKSLLSAYELITKFILYRKTLGVIRKDNLYLLSKKLKDNLKIKNISYEHF